VARVLAAITGRQCLPTRRASARRRTGKLTVLAFGTFA
jgi:hypothetical protein